MSTPIIAFHHGCGLVNKCANLNCYWNQRSQGLIPLTGAGMTIKQIQEVHEDNRKFEPFTEPRIRVEFGTDVNCLVCDDFQSNRFND